MLLIRFLSGSLLSIVVLSVLPLSLSLSHVANFTKNAGERRQIALSTTYVTNVAVGSDNGNSSNNNNNNENNNNNIEDNNKEPVNHYWFQMAYGFDWESG